MEIVEPVHGNIEIGAWEHGAWEYWNRCMGTLESVHGNIGIGAWEHWNRCMGILESVHGNIEIGV